MPAQLRHGNGDDAAVRETVERLDSDAGGGQVEDLSADLPSLAVAIPGHDGAVLARLPFFLPAVVVLHTLMKTPEFV